MVDDKVAGRSAAPPRTTNPALKDRGVQIAAAQLRLVTDRRLGKQTPDWIKKLAAEPDPSRLKTG